MSDEEKQPTKKQEKTKEKQPEPTSDQPAAETPVEKPQEKNETPETEPPTKQEKTPEPETPQEPTEPPSEEKQPEKPKQEIKETKEPTKSTPPAPPKEEKKPDTPPKKTDQPPTEKKDKKKTKKDKDDKPDDFQYIVRIANTDINGDYPLELGLSQIKGIGRRLACIIADHAGIKRSFKTGNLTDAQIEKIRETLTKIDEIAPTWMLNHQKDFDTGEDQHIISAEIELRLRDDVNLLKMIRSYRGIRHESRLPVRGQRTRANNRTGLTLGVSKKKQ